VGVIAGPCQSTAIPRCEHIWWISARRFVAALLPEALSQPMSDAASRIPQGSVGVRGEIFSARTKTKAAEKRASRSKNPNLAAEERGE
jgi:hypothetical protein